MDFILRILNQSQTIWKSRIIAKRSASISRQECSIQVRESREKRRVPLWYSSNRLLSRSWFGMLWMPSRTIRNGNTMRTTIHSWGISKPCLEKFFSTFSIRSTSRVNSRLLLRHELHCLRRLLWWSLRVRFLGRIQLHGHDVYHDGPLCKHVKLRKWLWANKLF